MSKTMTLEIPQGEWDKFQKELIRAIAVLQEQQRESEERWERITRSRAESEHVKQAIRKAREDVEKSLDAN